MNSFFEYLDKTKAEEDLKANTIVFVSNALAAGVQQGESENKASPVHKRSAVKKIAVAISAVAACVVLAAAGYTYYNTPVNYVSLDINPSVELGVNAFGSVICADGYNEDGNSILKEHRLKNLSLEEAISVLVQEAAKQGFISEDGSTVIAVTAQSDDEETAAELQEVSRVGVDKALHSCSTDAVIYADCSCMQLRTEAREQGISPGKYKLIQVLQGLDPNITVEQYKDAKVTDIITTASAYISASENGDVMNGENTESLEIIVQTARDVIAAKGCAEKEQSMCSGNMNKDKAVENKDPEQETAQGTDKTAPAQAQSQAQAQSAFVPEKKKSKDQTTSQNQVKNASLSENELDMTQNELQESQNQNASDVKQNQDENKSASGAEQGQKPKENSSSKQKTQNEDEPVSAQSKNDDTGSKDSDIVQKGSAKDSQGKGENGSGASKSARKVNGKS